MEQSDGPVAPLDDCLSGNNIKIKLRPRSMIPRSAEGSSELQPLDDPDQPAGVR